MRISGTLIAATLVVAVAASAAAQDRTGVTDTTIKIGVPAPLSGPNASFGAAAYGIQAYYTYVNEKGGVHGRKIDLILADHACNEAKGVAVAKKLISQDQVFLINGGVCSGVALACGRSSKRQVCPGLFPPQSIRRSPRRWPRIFFMPAKRARQPGMHWPPSC